MSPGALSHQAVAGWRGGSEQAPGHAEPESGWQPACQAAWPASACAREGLQQITLLGALGGWGPEEGLFHNILQGVAVFACAPSVCQRVGQGGRVWALA